MRILTVGHGTASGDELVRLLRGAGVRRLVDVRTAPGSRRNPDAARAALAGRLPEHGIAYRWERRLGGWRRTPADSPDTAVRNDSFRGYAAHMRSAEFLAAVDDLVAEAGRETTAVLCAEAVWWRCHRRMIADFLMLVRDVEVAHLMPDGRLRPHPPMPEARRMPGRDALVCDAGAGEGAAPGEGAEAGRAGTGGADAPGAERG